MANLLEFLEQVFAFFASMIADFIAWIQSLINPNVL